MHMQSMIKQMCKSELNDSDIKAISKSRGFPADGATSRDIFENFFISTIGIKEALNSLTYEEIVFLHLLNKIDKEVDIEYFERLYGCPGHTGGYDVRTFNQQYKETLKNVMNNLVRKGVLVIVETAILRKLSVPSFALLFHLLKNLTMPMLINALSFALRQRTSARKSLCVNCWKTTQVRIS
jgi:hypothetical protein